MADFQFNYDWRVAGKDAPEYQQTMAEIALHVGNVNLMRNQDIWSRTIRDSALISAYPLSMWLAYSWWRLNWEPLPPLRVYPSTDWRMAHELGAANHGFVWPRIIFASDGEVMQVWAEPLSVNEDQSIRYVNGLDKPVFISLTEFQNSVKDFISAVMERLDAVGCKDTDLADLWRIIIEDSSNHENEKYRIIEAQMGYDPDECPEELMSKALELDLKMGTAALSELAPVYGKLAAQTLTAIEEFMDISGPVGKPCVSRPFRSELNAQGPPWQRAVTTARALHQDIGNGDRVDNSLLCELLGLDKSDFENWSPRGRHNASVAVPDSRGTFKFIPRKKHPISKRFELARFIGDYLMSEQTNGHWLASTDLSTSRQKYQRAFAAEFLCPISLLQEFLQDDYSETAIEDAADYFEVSQYTVESLLANNGLIPPEFSGNYIDSGLPY